MQRQCYQFWRDEQGSEQLTGDGYQQYVEKQHRDDLNKVKLDPESALKASGKKVGPPRYNAMHDLESLFWIALWFICYHVPISKHSTWAGDAGNNQLNMAYTVFTEHYSMVDPPSNRQSCFTTNAGLVMVLEALPEGFVHVKSTLKLVWKHLQ